MTDLKTRALEQYDAFIAQVSTARTSESDGPTTFVRDSHWTEQELEDLRLILANIRAEGSISHFEEVHARQVFDTLNGIVDSLKIYPGLAPTLTELGQINVELQVAKNEYLKKVAATLSVADNGGAIKLPSEPKKTEPSIETVVDRQYRAFAYRVQTARASKCDGPNTDSTVSNWSQKELNELTLIVTGIRDAGLIRHFEDAKAREIFDTIAEIVGSLDHYNGHRYKKELNKLSERKEELAKARESDPVLT